MSLVKNGYKEIPVVTQKIVKEILTDKESFKKYVLNNKTILGGVAADFFYASSVVAYVSYLLNHGMVFSDEQKKIVRKCEQILHGGYTEYPMPLDVDKRDKFVQRNADIRKIVLDIVTDSNKIQQFIEGKISFGKYSMADIFAYAEDSNSVFSYYLCSSICGINKDVIQNLRKLKLLITLNLDFSDNNLNFEMDHELREKVMSMVSKDLIQKENKTSEDQVELAYQIYNALNSYVVYDEKIHLQNQGEIVSSEKMTEIKKAFYKNPEHVSTGDNRIICRNWSMIYAKLLREQGIVAHVADTKFHNSVTFFDRDMNIYGADSTDIQHKEIQDENIFRLPDIVRSKLGLNVTNFYKLNLDISGAKYREYYINGKFVKHKAKLSLKQFKLKGEKARIKIAFSKSEYEMFKSFIDRALNDEPIDSAEADTVIKILKTIEDANKMPKMFIDVGEDKKSKEETMACKIKVINRMLLSLKSRMNDDNLVNRLFTGNMAYLTMKKQGYDISDKFYKVDEKGNVKILPIIYAERSNSEEEWHAPDKMEIVYMMDEEKGLVRTSVKEIKQKLKKGELYFNYFWDPEDNEAGNELTEAVMRDDKKYSAFEIE